MIGLGDAIGEALARVGVTEDRVSKWLGKPCGCWRRKRKLNRLSKWAELQVGATVEEATEMLRRTVGRLV